MNPVCTFEDHNLGDQLVFLHLLRALAKGNPDRIFWHFTHSTHLEQLNDVVEDVKNIDLFSLDSQQWSENRDRAINAWKNSGATDTRKPHSGVYQPGFWEKSKHRWDWSAFTLEHHAHTAKQMGFETPFSIREHLLFDFPALNPNGIGGSYFYDFLIVNSEPCSGQFSPMREHGIGYLDELTKRLAKRFSVITTNQVYGVECTRDSKRSITDIGRLSLMCRNHIMVATGPMWATLNTTNHHHSSGRKRIVLLDNGESLNMPGVTQATTREYLMDVARKEGWL